tara:strand:- start:45549 stop:45722 length:174 start_codon:yes stop_codon:yes gene_type:complete
MAAKHLLLIGLLPVRVISLLASNTCHSASDPGKDTLPLTHSDSLLKTRRQNTFVIAL